MNIYTDTFVITQNNVQLYSQTSSLFLDTLCLCLNWPFCVENGVNSGMFEAFGGFELQFKYSSQVLWGAIYFGVG